MVDLSNSISSFANYIESSHDQVNNFKNLEETKKEKEKSKKKNLEPEEKPNSISNYLDIINFNNATSNQASKYNVKYLSRKPINQEIKTWVNSCMNNFKSFLKFFIYPIVFLFFTLIVFSLIIVLQKKYDITLNQDYTKYLIICTLFISFIFARSFDKWFSCCENYSVKEKNKIETQVESKEVEPKNGFLLSALGNVFFGSCEKIKTNVIKFIS